MAQLKPRNHKDAKPREGSGGKPPTLQKVFSARVEPEVIEEVERFIQASGWTKRQMIEYALASFFENVKPEKAQEMLIEAQRDENDSSLEQCVSPSQPDRSPALSA